MTWLGDFPEDFATVVCMFTTHAANGAPAAPSSALEAADVLIYKNGSATQKTSTNGVTMTSPFDSVTGLHCLTIDTSNDTGDSGFWTAGSLYTLVLVPDETVDSVAVAKVVGQFGIELYGALRPTTIGRRLDVSTGGEAGVDWANVGGATTAVALSNTTVGLINDAITAAKIASNAITDAKINSGALTSAKFASGAFDAVWTVTTRLLTAGTNIALAKGTGVTGFNDLDAAGVRGAVGLASANLDTQLATIAGHIDTEIWTLQGTADAIKAKTDDLTFTVSGQVDTNIKSVAGTAVTGSGTEVDPWGP